MVNYSSFSLHGESNIHNKDICKDNKEQIPSMGHLGAPDLNSNMFVIINQTLFHPIYIILEPLEKVA
jgi:hypothetical protein